MEYQGIKEIHDRFEAIISNLRQQFAKFNDEREKRENKIKKEASDPINEFLPISTHIQNYLEWDTNSLLLEEQTISTYEDYLKGLYRHLRDIKNQKERLNEATEELDRKDEDLEMMAEMIKQKNEEIKKLIEDGEKLRNMLRKIKSGNTNGNNIEIKQPQQSIINPAIHEIDSERESLFDELVSANPKKSISTKRVCDECGKDISSRKTDAKYCIDCAYITKRKRDRIRLQKKRGAFDKKGDPIEEDNNDEEGTPDIIEDTEDQLENGNNDESQDKSDGVDDFEDESGDIDGQDDEGGDKKQ